MPVPGYDPDDLDASLREHLSEESARELLDDEERAAYREGDDLVEALDTETIEALLDDR